MKNKYYILSTFLGFIFSLFFLQKQSVWASNILQSSKVIKKGQLFHVFEQENETINLKAFLATPSKHLLKLGSADSLGFLKKQQDNINCEHAVFQQYHKNILVEAAILKVHECEKQALKANGNLAIDLTVNTTPHIDKEEALEKALQMIDGQKYAWQNEALERQLQQVKKDVAATFKPKGKLVVLSEQFFPSLKKSHLAYKFAIYAEQPLQYKTIYIDAHTGTFLLELNRLHQHETMLNGTAQYACETTVDFTADYDENSEEYCLQNNTTVVYDAENTADFIDTHICSSHATFEDSAAVAVLWASKQGETYFKTVHNHENIGEANQILAHWLHYEEGFCNAFWNGNWFVYGDGDGINYDAFVSLDIVAHEMTHALIDNTANLIYAYEAGALNEGFSDIFAILIQHFAEPNCVDWIIGDAVVKQMGKNGLRNLANPKDATMINRQPNTYKGEFWHYEATDNGGVHINSGVLSYWFYLLVEGGSGTNDLQDAYLVNGMGWEAAAAIVYRTLTTYLTPTSQYIDARNASIEATIDLFGEDSEELTELLNAWHAVGLAADLNSDKSLTYTSFNNNEVLLANSFVDITWQSTGFINTVTLELSTDNGNVWHTIAQNVSNNGLFTWQVPNIATDLARLRITDSNDINVFDLNDTHFYIENCPVISAFSVANNNICQNESLTFFNTTSSNAHTFRWLINNTAISQSQDFEFSFPESGLYEIKLKATDTILNCTNIYTETIEVEPNVSAQFAYTIDGLQIDAFISSDTLTVSSYEWQFDNSFFENVPSFTHLVESAGIYELCLNVQSNCNASIFCQDITVLTPAICEGDDTWLYHISGNQINDIAESINDFWIASDGGLSVWHKIDGSVNTYTSYNSGLTDNQVNTVAVAPNNDKWIGTQNGGLLLFRNGTWHTYHTTNSNLPSQTVYDIKIDANGAKWVATTNGLLRINGGIWRVFNTSNSNLPSNMIQCLEINANGDMWIGSDNGLFFYDKQNQISTTYTYENDALQSNNIQTLAIDNDNIIWIGYKNGGLDILEETNVTNHNDKLPNQYVKDILIDAENTKWIATKSGILQFDNENWSLFNSENSAFNHNTINSLLLANSGAKWIGTEDGIYSYMNENWQAFDATTAVLPHNETTAIAIDDSQNIWTTSVAGLIQHTNGEWIIHNQETVPNLESQHFTSIAIDENNVKWIASFDKGLFRFDGENWANFSTENSNLTSNHIFQVEANNNDIWLTQSDKLVYFDGVNFLNFDFEMSIEPTALMVDELQNRVWIGTKNNGLIAFHNDNGFSYYYEYNSLISDNQINSLLLQNEKLWIATQSGLFTYENETWNVPNTDNDLLNNDIINILTKDAQGRLVAISQHYVYLQKNNLWESYAIPQSASFSQNLDAVVDEDLKIWLATTRGIAIQARSAEANAFFEITNTETCENYTIDCVNKSIGANRFEWFINGVLASEDADLIYEFTQAGNYNISLIAINESGCEDVFSQEINVYSNAHLVSLPDQIAVCIEDDNPIIEATATDMTSYEWRRNGVLISNEYFCEATQQGRYELFITDNCGNEKMLETHIYIDNDCVWPGDLNNDQIVNHHDLLALSLTIGQYGQQRPNANSNWQGQPSFDWGVIAANTNDLKHIDANGNGVIDLSDIQMIDFHYGKTHHNQSVNIPPDLSSDVNFRANLTTPPTATNNKTMEINLEVTHKNDIDIHAYGIAFDIEYALPAGLNMNHIDLDFSDSWLNVNENDVQTIYRHFPEQNKIEVAITRIDHQNASNTGIMAKLRAEVDVVPSGTSSIMVMNIHNILFINNEGLQIPIATSQNSLNILPENESTKNAFSSFDAVNIYPNPANDYVSIVFEHEMKNMQIALYNMQGKHFVPKVSKQANNTFLLHVSDIPTGLYQLVAFTEKKRWHTSKLMIYR